MSAKLIISKNDIDMQPEDHNKIEPRTFGLKYIVLSILSKYSLTGAEIISNIEKMTIGFFHPSPGSIYPLLKYLHKEGYIEAEEKNGKKTYRISRKGKEFMDSIYPPFGIFGGFKTFRNETNDVAEALNTLENYTEFLSETNLKDSDVARLKELVKKLNKIIK